MPIVLLKVEQQHRNIWNAIKELLHKHDCVIVPNFGGFVCNREPAGIDQVSYVITPPSRKVVFNQNLKTNDGLLANYLVQKEHLSFSESLKWIENTVTDVIVILQDNKQYSIDLFGAFKLNADANYVFVADKRINFLIGSFGLAMVQAQPVISRTITTPKVNIFKEIKQPVPSKARRRFMPTFVIASLVILLALNGYIFWQNQLGTTQGEGNNQQIMSIASWFDSVFTKTTVVENKTESPQIRSEELDPPLISLDTTNEQEILLSKELSAAIINSNQLEEKVSTEKLEHLKKYAPYFAFATHYPAARLSLYVPRRGGEETSFDNNKSNTENEIPSRSDLSSAKKSNHLNTEGIEKGYYVIGGVFCVDKNAARFLKSLAKNGFTGAQLLLNKHISCKRISYKRFSSKLEAENFCTQIKTTVNEDAWILAAE